MGEKYLIVKGCAGLGNRISTVCSAIEYAKETDRTLLVDWADGGVVQEGYNFFDDYFYLKDVVHLTSYNGILEQKNLSFYPDVRGCDITSSTYKLFDKVVASSKSRIPFHRLPRSRVQSYRRHWRVKKKEGEDLPRKSMLLLDSKVVPFGGDMPKRIRKDVVFFLDYTPAFSKKTAQRHLVLKKKIKEKIDLFLKEKLDAGKAIGIHVRSTDKQPDTEIKDLVDQIKSFERNKLKIFLCTDNVDVQRELMNELSNVTVFPKNLPKVDSGGIHHWSVRNKDHERAIEILESSIIDMYLLSGCEFLFFQGNSSFSNIAAMMHGNEQKAVDWNATTTS